MPEIKIDSSLNVEADRVEMEGAENVTVRWLISEDDGAPNFAMRLFEVGSGGCSPFHAHDWEHEVYILEGEGRLRLEDGDRDFAAGHFIFVPGGKKHAFVNAGDGKLKFLCMVPNG